MPDRDELDLLLLAVSKLLQDAHLASDSLVDPGSVLTSPRGISVNLKISLRHAKEALSPFLGRLDQAWSTRDRARTSLRHGPGERKATDETVSRDARERR